MSLKDVTDHLRKVILQHNPALATTITPLCQSKEMKQMMFTCFG